MEMRIRQVEKYTTLAGNCPFDEWYSRLKDKATRARIFNRIERIKSGSLGDWKVVGEGVKELRLDFGAGYRLYIGEEGESVVILLVGGDKSTQAKDIVYACDLWKEHQNANKRRI
jgi:putative addiction module killer protein